MVDVRTNLLKNRHTLSEKDYQRERTILRYSVVTIVVVVIVVIALSVWNLVLTRKMSQIEAALTESSKEMQGLTTASAQQVYLKSRLTLITGFLNERGVARESLQKIFSTDIAGVHVGGVSFESETVLSIDYVADSSSSLDKLIAYYEADNDYFTQAVTSGVTRAKEGTYQITVDLTLPKGGK
jgi:cytoskeletal protein RodZ